MSFLNRSEDDQRPSCPCRTQLPAPYAAYCVTPKMLPIQALLLTSAPGEPIAITLLAVATAPPALAPKAVLLLPVLFKSAWIPMAVF